MPRFPRGLKSSMEVCPVGDLLLSEALEREMAGYRDEVWVPHSCGPRRTILMCYVLSQEYLDFPWVQTEVQRESPHGNYLISTVLLGRDRPKETGLINIEVVTSGKKL